jgi:protein-S-isoprenylcysteine O-methyltransferase Ste14
MAARLFAWTGAAIFAATLALFGQRYLVTFGAPMIDETGGVWRPVLVDLALFTVFALHHTLFARMGVKALVIRVVPAALQRSVYVWVASILFASALIFWQPVPGVAWCVTGASRFILFGLQAAGGWITLASARRLDTLDLAGVRQLDPPAQETMHTVITDGWYAVVRHPIYFAWLLMVWPAPVMTGTRLVFAGVSTLYLCAAIPFEERDLGRTFGGAYAAYAAHVRARLVPFIY